MTVLTVLQEKLGEAHGLAIAATATLDRVEERVRHDVLRRELDAMRLDASETRARCLDVERRYGEEVAEAVLAHANTTAERAADMAAAWFKAGTGPLSAWSFLAMGEAAEVTVWSALRVLASERAEGVAGLASWALPVQERHLRAVLEGAVLLADGVDPGAARWG